LIPSEWVAAATSYQTPNNGDTPEWAQGYGYQFWRCRHNAYRGDGAFGQYALIMPDQDAVLAMTSGVGDMQAVLDQVWTHLLPAMGDEARAENSDAQAALEKQLATLALPIVAGRATSPSTQEYSGERFLFRDVPKSDDPRDLPLKGISFIFGEDKTICHLEDSGGQHDLVCGHGKWIRGTTTYAAPDGQPIAGCGAWTAEDTYTMKVQFTNRPFSITMTCRFAEDKLHYQSRLNVNFGPLEGPMLVGKVV